MSALQELLGNEFVDAHGAKHTAADLAGKTVGIYFSAHWCPPCKGFTPMLAKFYKMMKDSGKAFEVVFVSSDKNETEWSHYLKESMPWLAIPYANRDLKGKLSKKYKVQGIPTLVLVDSEGKTITTDARTGVMEDPQGNEFPWVPKPPKPVLEMLGEELVDNQGKTHAVSSLKGKPFGIYFSAHWCPPCKAFTPVLIETYKKINHAEKKFEIVFASSDNSAEEFKEYFHSMPWLAIPLDDPRKDALSEQFEVEGIPTFILFDENGKLITKEGRGSVSADPEGKDFPWIPKPLDSLQKNASDLGDRAGVVLMADHAAKDVQEAMMKELNHVAEQFASAAKASGEDAPVSFSYSTSPSQVSTRVEQLCQLGKDACIILLDLAEGAFYKLEGTVTANAIQHMVDEYNKGTLAGKTPLKA